MYTYIPVLWVWVCLASGSRWQRYQYLVARLHATAAQRRTVVTSLPALTSPRLLATPEWCGSGGLRCDITIRGDYAKVLLGIFKSLRGGGTVYTRQSLGGKSKFTCKQRDNCIAAGHQAVSAFGVEDKSALLTKFQVLFVLLLFRFNEIF